MFTLYCMAYALTRKPYWKGLLFTHKIGDIGAYSAQRRLLKWRVTCRIRCSNYNGKIFVSAWKAVRFCVKIAFVQVPYNANEYHFKWYSGLLIFRGISGANSRKNRPISREKVIIRGENRPIFAGEKSKFAGKSFDFAKILAEKSQISKDFQGQILRKIGRFPGLFHGKFRGETSPRNNR